MQIDESVINSFAQNIDDERITYALNSSVNVISSALEIMQEYNPYVSKNFELIVVDDFYSGAVTPQSVITLLLIVDNAQIKLNTEELVSKKLKAFWLRLKFAWKNRNKYKKKKKHKKKQKVEEIKIVEVQDKYTIPLFNKDLIIALSKCITEKDYIKLKNGVLLVEGNNFPFKIKIIPILSKNESYEFYDSTKNKFVNIDLKQRNENLKKLIDFYGEAYTNMYKIFANLYSTLMDKNAEPAMIESLLSNLPDKAFEKDIYGNFIYASNYLANKKLSELFSICDPQNKLIDDPLCKTNLMDLYTFMNKLIINC